MTNLILIGPMGAGKTTIGRQLAHNLHYRFFDSDREIEERTGVDIGTIFEYEGEQGFRRRETAVIEQLTARHHVVLATGGGAVLSPINREHFKAQGYTVLINISVDEQVTRTAMDKTRPLLQVENPREALQRMREERLPIYRSVADMELHSDRQSVGQIVATICTSFVLYKKGLEERRQ